MEIIKALKDNRLVGLGGAGFPTWQKWQAVSESPGSKKFVICNLSEGEPGVFKDEYILQNHLQKMVAGIQLAAAATGASRSYIFLNDKYKKYLGKINKNIRGKKIEVFIDTGRYLCGEETTLLQVMEGKTRQPRQKPPYPTTVGLYGYPTLINNAETLYRAYLISEGEEEIKRFYSLSGDIIQQRIIEGKIGATIKEIIPDKLLSEVNFFRLSGPSGTFIAGDNFEQIVEGTGAIEIFSKKIDLLAAIKNSILFLENESCGKCTPCREGTYRLNQEIEKLASLGNFWEKGNIFDRMVSIAEAAKESSFCPLGASIIYPVESGLKLLRQQNVKKL